jgi:hypothetical protein
MQQHLQFACMSSIFSSAIEIKWRQQWLTVAIAAAG